MRILEIAGLYPEKQLNIGKKMEPMFYLFVEQNT